MTSKQIDRLLEILDRFVKIAELWADREYPQSDENIESNISRAGDRPIPQSVEEYNSFEPETALERRLRRQS